MSTRTAAWIAVPICLLNIALGVLGFTFGVLNGYSLLELADESPSALLALSMSIVGALVASRRPQNPIGWIFCVVGLSQGLVTFAYGYSVYALITQPGALGGGAVMAWFGSWIWMPGFGLFLTFALLLFPDGHLPSPRWRVLAWLSAIDLALIVPIAIAMWPIRGRALLGDVEQALPESFSIIFDAFLLLIYLAGLASVMSLIVRYQRSQGIERQQLKWFTCAGAISFTAVGISGLITELGTILLPIIAPSLPVAAGIAILRYRLYDIDLIIRRTLIYSTLTFILALIYVGCIVVIRTLVAPLTGGSELAIVASTLAIASLFNPLRRRIQTLIDRRFYRRKYDAATVLAAFGTTVRDETDLDALTNAMLYVVDETMQPEFVGLWLIQQTTSSRRK